MSELAGDQHCRICEQCRECGGDGGMTVVFVYGTVEIECDRCGGSGKEPAA